MEKIKLEDVSKVYPGQDQAVIEDLNLSIRDKEFIVLVGSSGSGKSTVLRMIAGLEEISSGKLYIDDQINNHIPPKDRDIAMVFQNYALFPHMDVYENIEYGMKVRAVDKQKRKEKVEKVAGMLGLTPYLKRKPKELSGGQQQRVALARALVRDSSIFLMDEPLSNLDAKLRTQMREEIIQLHQQIQATFIYVTHDQSEAMTMADRIVVMEKGQIMQVGRPEEIYNQPQNIFVAGFMGEPKMNFLPAHINSTGQLTIVDQCQLEADSIPATAKANQQALIIGIRPEDIHLSDASSADFKAEVDYSEMTGADSYIHCQIAGQALTLRTQEQIKLENKASVNLKLNQEKLHFFDKHTGQALNK